MTATRAFRHNPVVSRLPFVGHQDVGHVYSPTRNWITGVPLETDRDDLRHSSQVLAPTTNVVPSPLWLIRGQPFLQVDTMDRLDDKYVHDESPPEVIEVE